MRKIVHLEGLRGIAAMVVFFGHLKSTLWNGEYNYLSKLLVEADYPFMGSQILLNLLALLIDGTLAVWIFWALSSYVISIKLFKKSDNYDKVIIGYFSKRYVRLAIPVLASVLFAYVLLKAGLMFNHTLASSATFANRVWLSSFYNFPPDILFALKSALYDTFFFYNNNTSYNSVLWTIQYEFLGSLFTFSIFGVIRHNKVRFFFYLIIFAITIKLRMLWLAAFVIGHVLADFDFSSFNKTFYRKLKIYEYLILKKYSILLFLGLMIVLLGRSTMTSLHIPMDFQNLFLSVFIVYLCMRSRLMKTILGHTLPAFLGKISFAFYLIHIPIICSFTSYALLQNNTLLYRSFIALATFLISLLLSVLFEKYVDRTAVRTANKMGDYFKAQT